MTVNLTKIEQEARAGAFLPDSIPALIAIVRAALERREANNSQSLRETNNGWMRLCEAERKLEQLLSEVVP